MKNVFMAMVLLTSVLVSCSGFFDKNPDQADDSSLSPLSISGGGYLSTDNANEITPFLFHDTNSGKNWLFFSSDRSGNYDLYFAELNANGTFNPPVKMSLSINTTNNEFSPALFYGYYSYTIPTNYLYISYLQVSNGLTNVLLAQLNADLSFFSGVVVSNNYAVTRISPISLTNLTDGHPLLMCALGISNWSLLSWNHSSLNFDTASAITIRINPDPYPNYSVNGYVVPGSGVTNLILDSLNAGKHQLYFASFINISTTNFKKISAYDSIYNDRDPYIDLATMKVYFSSDRKGTYDLYRYNTKTFDTVTP